MASSEGTALTVGNYVFPVPANWYVENEGNHTFMIIGLDTDDSTPLRKLNWNASILLLPQRPMKAEGLNRLLSVEFDFLKSEESTLAGNPGSLRRPTGHVEL